MGQMGMGPNFILEINTPTVCQGHLNLAAGLTNQTL
jgi:hypothetical protein